ncbi:DUF2382 domain-containing protein [Modestobacter sp. I12A-02628]|uniref:PRC and DUF2382 domain-containing protein n=1 Tax=Goekera deserti TaxID=2497753 RepID=A0A7K3WL31_9ACTN|nr:PRC and DUF2382 domain-containing protein [Goekera deserti]MPR00547.1 DUF2382 domain-containing protein [Goekera deserti]NDI50483.1 DUF2382 domain-containing protein [Goekera deserti]NEL56579.1 PRC and DUF2382 domain-containing protein [Goekera deserti]
MLSETQLDQVIGSTAYDRDGDKIGKVGQLYLDDQTGQPSWITVHTGLFGTKETFVPAGEATFSGGDLRLPVEKGQVKGAPKVDVDGHLDPQEEEELYRYYGFSGNTTTDTNTTTTGTAGQGLTGQTTGQVTGTDTNHHGTVGHDTSGPITDDAMTRSEEQLHVGTQRVETGRARLRKHIVSENVTQTVPVRREEVRIEREPITEANRGAAYDGPAISEEEHEVTLHAERPVVAKETVPVERVRLDTETVTSTETVTDTVRKEQIEADTDADVRTRR